MSCSTQFQSALHPLHTWPKHKQLVATPPKLLWLSTTEPIKLASQTQQHHLSLGTKCKAIMQSYDAIILGVTPPVKSGGDISVLLQVGGVLLVAYVFSNFVVPNLISEYFGFNKLSEDEEDEDVI